MHVKMEEKDGATIVKITGEIDINTSPELRKEFERPMSEQKKIVSVDFSDVSYVDSSGLATLVEILKKMRAYGGKLELLNLSAKVLALFEITKLSKLFVIKGGGRD